MMDRFLKLERNSVRWVASAVTTIRSRVDEWLFVEQKYRGVGADGHLSKYKLRKFGPPTRFVARFLVMILTCIPPVSLIQRNRNSQHIKSSKSEAQKKIMKKIEEETEKRNERKFCAQKEGNSQIKEKLRS